ncbi:MAG: MarR family transcriptional regulator [Streptomyces sp.]|nr:MarR family transcriptional regulator [Streptomyces sp.]
MTSTAPTAAYSSAPPVDPRVIALAHYAGRAVLEHILARHGATFQQQITLRPLAAEGPLQREELVRQVADALKTDAAEVQGVIEELITKGLVAAEASGVHATEAGRAFHAEVSAETAVISARIYAGIPAQDLAAAGRVLALVAERANAELAALTA